MQILNGPNAHAIRHICSLKFLSGNVGNLKRYQAISVTTHFLTNTSC